MTFHTDIDFKPKSFRGKKVYILAKDVDPKKVKSKPKQFRLEKGLFFWVPLIQAVVSTTLRLLSKYFSVYKI